MLILAANTLAYPSSQTLDEAWALNRTLQFKEAEKRLRDYKPKSGEETWRSAFARAVTLLSVQPRTSGNIEKAYSLLEPIVTSAAGDDLKAWTLYYRGRIDQLHRTEPNMAQALRFYRDLIELYPEHLASQLAFTKMTIIRLYADPKNRPSTETLLSLEKEAGFLQSAFARNQFHTVMAAGYLFFELGREQALEHLLAARALGSFEIIDLGNDFLQIANIAYELGKRDLALSSYRRFLQMRPESSFSFMIRERIEELKDWSDGAVEDWNGGVTESNRNGGKME